MSSQNLSTGRSVALVCTLLVSAAVFGVSTNSALAKDCLSAPHGAAPKGQHWFYRIDHATKRKCWYVRSMGSRSHRAATSTSSKASATERATSKTVAAASASECHSAPKASAPKGEHWYFHTDRATSRKCWFLAATGEPSHPVATKADTTPTTQDSAAAKPAAAAARKPASKSNADNASNSAAVETHAEDKSSTTKRALTGQGVQDTSSVWSAPAAPVQSLAAQAHPLARSSDQAKAATSGAAQAQSDPPATAPAKSATRPTSISRTGSVAASAESRAPEAKRPALSAVTTHVAAMPGSPTTAELLLIAALVLAAVGLFYRLVIKATGLRSPRLAVDHAEPGWIDDSHPSIVPNASDLDFRPPFESDVERQGKSRRQPRIVEEASDREDKLKQMIRDIDQLLKSRNRA